MTSRFSFSPFNYTPINLFLHEFDNYEEQYYYKNIVLDTVHYLGTFYILDIWVIVSTSVFR
jgi:hypothetical protein